jgi:hypothetical protein
MGFLVMSLCGSAERDGAKQKFSKQFDLFSNRLQLNSQIRDLGYR